MRSASENFRIKQLERLEAEKEDLYTKLKDLYPQGAEKFFQEQNEILETENEQTFAEHFPEKKNNDETKTTENNKTHQEEFSITLNNSKRSRTQTIASVPKAAIFNQKLQVLLALQSKLLEKMKQINDYKLEDEIKERKRLVALDRIAQSTASASLFTLGLAKASWWGTKDALNRANQEASQLSSSYKTFGEFAKHLAPVNLANEIVSMGYLLKELWDKRNDKKPTTTAFDIKFTHTIWKIFESGLKTTVYALGFVAATAATAAFLAIVGNPIVLGTIGIISSMGYLAREGNDFILARRNLKKVTQAFAEVREPLLNAEKQLVELQKNITELEAANYNPAAVNDLKLKEKALISDIHDLRREVEDQKLTLETAKEWSSTAKSKVGVNIGWMVVSGLILAAAITAFPPLGIAAAVGLAAIAAITIINNRDWLINSAKNLFKGIKNKIFGSKKKNKKSNDNENEMELTNIKTVTHKIEASENNLKISPKPSSSQSHTTISNLLGQASTPTVVSNKLYLIEQRIDEAKQTNLSLQHMLELDDSVKNELTAISKIYDERPQDVIEKMDKLAKEYSDYKTTWLHTQYLLPIPSQDETPLQQDLRLFLSEIVKNGDLNLTDKTFKIINDIYQNQQISETEINKLKSLIVNDNLKPYLEKLSTTTRDFSIEKTPENHTTLKVG